MKTARRPLFLVDVADAADYLFSRRNFSLIEV